MSVTVGLPALFSDRIDGMNPVEVEGSNVAQVLEALTDRFPVLVRLVWSAESTLNPVMVLFLNGTQIEQPVLERPVRDGDEVTIVPSIEGG